MTESSTVFVVDDDDAVLDAVTLLLESVGLTVEGYGDAQAFLDTVESDRAGCIVLDVRMPGMSGLDLQKKLNELGSSLPIIFVTGHGDVPMAVQAMREGAVEFLQKPFRDQDLIDRVQTALQADLAHRQSSSRRDEVRARLARLTERERQVLEQLVDGKSTKQIAGAFDLSPRTVEIHRARVLEKMQAGSVAELVKLTLEGL